MVDEDKAKELQQKYMEHQMLSQQIQQVEPQLNKMRMQISEIGNIIEGISSLGKKELLAPLSNGIFVKTEISQPDTLLVNVGANTVVEKSRDETVKMLQRQSELITDNVEQGEEQLRKMKDQAGIVEKDLNKLI